MLCPFSAGTGARSTSPKAQQSTRWTGPERSIAESGPSVLPRVQLQDIPSPPVFLKQFALYIILISNSFLLLLVRHLLLVSMHLFPVASCFFITIYLYLRTLGFRRTCPQVRRGLGLVNAEHRVNKAIESNSSLQSTVDTSGNVGKFTVQLGHAHTHTQTPQNSNT